MARHHKKKKRVGTHRRRNHKMGDRRSIETGILTFAGAIGGGLVTAFGVNAFDTAFAKQSIPLPLAPGLFATAGLAAMIFGGKMPILMGVGAGAAAIGGGMMLNELGLNVPGLSGLAMTSNTPNANVFQKTLGCNTPMKKMGSGPAGGNYVNSVLGRRRSTRTMGILASN